MGLVSRVVEREALMTVALDMAHRLTENSPNAQASAIQAVQASGAADGFQIEIDAFGRCFNHPDFKEGVAAFLGKRKPEF